MIQNLDVMLWGQKAGVLVASKSGYDTRICFYFDPEFIKTGYDIAPLKAPISGPLARRGLPIYPESDRLYGGLPSFIADSLPDHWGNIVFKEWAKSRRISMRNLSPLDRLAYIGSRGMGALEFVPATAPESECPFKVEISELSQLAGMAVKEAENFHGTLSPDFLIESLFRVGTSAGGRRPKAVINVNPESGECYSGQVTTPREGFVPMIIKFDEHSDIPTTRIEYSYYLMARAAGIEMKMCRLVDCGRETHFLTERFDRNGSEKIHTQTLAAISPGATSYESMMEAAHRCRIGHDGIDQLFLRMVMNVVGGNVDDHSKNFSFMMDRTGAWTLAPAYDYTFAIDPDAPHYVNRHSLSINGKTGNIIREDLLTVARMYDVKGAKGLIDRCASAANNYRLYGLEAGLDDNLINRIEDRIKHNLKAILPAPLNIK